MASSKSFFVTAADLQASKPQNQQQRIFMGGLRIDQSVPVSLMNKMFSLSLSPHSLSLSPVSRHSIIMMISIENSTRLFIQTRKFCSGFYYFLLLLYLFLT